MRSDVVAIIGVGAQDGSQMRLTKDNDVAEAFAAE
jgi:hypothetical protein